jgi:hypothetical protein
MNQYQRAAQLWSLLVFAAQTQKILSYTMIENLTRLPKVGVGGFLSPIQDYCKHHELPPLTALVVNEDTGLPGGGFTGATDVFAAQSRVFVFNWFKHKSPTPEDFEKTDHVKKK